MTAEQAARLDMLTAEELTAASAFAREHDEWRAVQEIPVDESEFAPEILPEDISEAFDVITEPPTIRRPRRIRVGTDLSWAFEGEG